MKQNNPNSTIQTILKNIKNFDFTDKKAIILFSLPVILITIILFFNFLGNYNTRSNIIVITGSAQKDIVSDLIVWSGNFSATSMDLKDAYSKLHSDMNKIKAFLEKNGVLESEIVFESIFMNRQFKNIWQNNFQNMTSVFDGYSLSQNVRIESNEVDKIERISREITELIEQGVELSSFPPQYFYTNIAELRKVMVGLATADAYSRAQQVAKNSKARLGKLKNARVGVFQITGKNSAESFSSGGTFNTHSKYKTISINVRLEYGIR